MTDMSEAYNDFLFWRRPLAETRLGTSRDNDRITNWLADERDWSASNDHAGYSDLLFWRRPLAPRNAPWADAIDPPSFVFRSTPSPPPVVRRPPSPLGLDAAPAISPAAISSSPAAHTETAIPDQPLIDDPHSARGDVAPSDDEMDSGVDPSLLRLLQGGSGATLVTLLSGISSRLGSSSRFAIAADRLRADVHTLRESQADASAVGGVVRPQSGSALHDTQVVRSVGSMLRTLDNGVVMSPMQLPAAMAVRSAEAALVPAIGPASPHAMQALELLSGQGLPELGPADSCTICLEPMLGCPQLLRMPCSLAHTYHRACLARWLQTSSSCPLCRERLEETPRS